MLQKIILGYDRTIPVCEIEDPAHQQLQSQVFEDEDAPGLAS